MGKFESVLKNFTNIFLSVFSEKKNNLKKYFLKFFQYSVTFKIKEKNSRRLKNIAKFPITSTVMKKSNKIFQNPTNVFSVYVKTFVWFSFCCCGLD